MAKTIYVDRPDATMARLAAAVNYTGRMFKVKVHDPESNIRYASYWDGGSRDTFTIAELATGRMVGLPPNHPFFDPKTPETVPIVPGFVVVEHSIFCGKDMGLTFHVHEADANRLALPAPTALSTDETTVLTYTRNLKSSYAGISNYRFHSARRDGKIASIGAWEAAKASLIGKRLLTAAGAITAAGRNAVEGVSW